MPTGTYVIDATNNAEPLDSRYVADFPAELRAMKTRMNAAISSIGALTGALMADGTNNMTGKLGVGGVASAGLMFHLYGNARMEGTVTVIGKQDITGSSFVPNNASVSNAVSTVRGAYGGGYVMVDGAVYGGSWLSAGAMFLGLGTSSGLTEKIKVATNDFQFTSDAQAQVTSKASNGYASFYINSSGANPGHIFFGNASGERARITGSGDASMQFCIGTGAENVLSLNSNKSATLYGSEISIGVATPGEKRLRLRNSNRESAIVLESGGAAVHLWDITGNNALWTSNMAGDFTATGNVYAYSDEKFKENILPIKNALATVSQIEGRTFTYKATGVSGIGFIAQELEKVVPELVSDFDGTKAVAYGNMTALLVEAIKELKAEVNYLKHQLELRDDNSDN